MVPDGALDVDVHGPDKKRQKLADVLVETRGMDPIGQSTDAATAEALAAEGLVDLASVKTVAGGRCLRPYQWKFGTLAAVATAQGSAGDDMTRDGNEVAIDSESEGMEEEEEKEEEEEEKEEEKEKEKEEEEKEPGAHSVGKDGVPERASLGRAGTGEGNALASAERRVARAAPAYFAEASLAMLEIAEGKLYSFAGHASFQDYIRKSSAVLGFGLRQARNLIAAARVIRNLPADVARPSNERQVRPLVGCHPDVQLKVWVLALERADGDTRHEDALSLQYGGLPVITRSDTCEWYTPDFILDLVRELFTPGCIDLDPCSCAAANTRVRATSFYDEATDGLAEGNAWRGNVFLNPAFGVRRGQSLQELFFGRCKREYQAGNVRQAVVLLKAGIGCSWFNDVLNWPVCFLRERLSFVRQVGTSDELQWGARALNPHGSVIAYMGPAVERFATLFSRIGSVPGMNSWAHVRPVLRR
ncbi:hypothetical protein VOLCADRAFT_91459 [Volvox carteri f. nagariensis]|uniref:Uncharacterized protein n=1 Tax=Volvox carteri f. nagariensis TaxID=3068 RepID=D8TX50_VOLCA|nr:uncharacterized protein VOLCADRAFT_91459 [Volvox carteri f. nagariensis]EFJ47950.1 hypothetical protein VOLCADRAFT_91459 [Volvox carteri f. nagariensis]|eukprot:XP_002951056.1 hypothetical protein VOLCADRAFT_91459 [Volvox carteri f. nagariensis]